MEKQIVFTVSERNKTSVHIKTKSNLADENHKHQILGLLVMFEWMQNLTSYYNDKGVSVLFEVE